jgi:hypothetical protein
MPQHYLFVVCFRGGPFGIQFPLLIINQMTKTALPLFDEVTIECPRRMHYNLSPKL